MPTRSAEQKGAIAGQALSTGASVASTVGAAVGIFSAAAAANAVPIAGQFASAGLAIAGLLTKIFVGRKQKKEAAAKEKRQGQLDKASEATKAAVVPDSASGVGQGPQESAVSTAPVRQPGAPTFSAYGGGPAPTMQPSQQALNNSIGLK